MASRSRPGQPAVGGKAFGQDQQVGLLLRDAVVVGAEQAADVGEGVLLRGEGAAVGEREHLLRDLLGRPVRVPGSRSRMNQAFSANRQASRYSGMPWRAQTAFTASMFAIETGCPPPELLVTVSITSGIFAAPSARDQRFQRGHVHVALEIQPRLRVGGFGDGQVDGARAGEFDVGARGIEVRIGGDDVPRLAHHGEQDALGGASLVRRDHVAEAGELVHHALQAEEALAAGVGFVAAHHRRPLLRGHGAGAGIGQQVDQDVARLDQEEVVAGRFQIAARAPPAWCGAAARRS